MLYHTAFLRALTQTVSIQVHLELRFKYYIRTNSHPTPDVLAYKIDFLEGLQGLHMYLDRYGSTMVKQQWHLYQRPRRNALFVHFNRLLPTLETTQSSSYFNSDIEQHTYTTFCTLRLNNQ